MSVTLVGAKPKTSARLSINIEHSGQVSVVAPDTGKVKHFTHFRRLTVHTYDVVTNATFIKVGNTSHATDFMHVTDIFDASRHVDVIPAGCIRLLARFEGEASRLQSQ